MSRKNGEGLKTKGCTPVILYGLGSRLDDGRLVEDIVRD